MPLSSGPAAGIVRIAAGFPVPITPQYAIREPSGDQAGLTASPLVSSRRLPSDVETTQSWLTSRRAPAYRTPSVATTISLPSGDQEGS